MSIGNRVYLKRNLPNRELVEAFRRLPAANVADCMGRSCAMSPRIKLISRQIRERMCGPALTVKARAGDNLMLHKALNIAEKGDILVCSNEGDSTRALIGEVYAAYAAFKKIGGIVLDGPIRDIDALKDIGIPIYATGSTPGGPYKEGPGEINTPIACGNISINPGDIILGDEDGVIVIPFADAEDLLEKAKAFAEQDYNKMITHRNGCPNRTWVDKALAAKGCEIIDGAYGDLLR